MTKRISVVGAGPAGLRAAEVAVGAGIQVDVFDAMPSAGRKFLVAGRGGLNLTNVDSEIITKYSGHEMPDGLWIKLLEEFDPVEIQKWAAGLGIETLTVSSGRVYPREMKSAPLLRRWIARLKSQDVQFHHRHRWARVGRAESGSGQWQLEFETPSGHRTIAADAIIFALGGGSWPQTGSDGTWQQTFRQLGVAVEELVPANCGWEVSWPRDVVQSVAGRPLKNVRGSAGTSTAYGELLITDYGFEGGVIYTLTPALRRDPVLQLDLKPAFSFEQLISRLPANGAFHLHEAFERCRIQEAARVIMRTHVECGNWRGPAEFAKAVKSLRIPLSGPRPLDEAISSAGGVRWENIDENLMLKQYPGIFLAGEMLDWEAPTGGYLMQGCFSTGTLAGRSANTFVRT